MTQRSFEWLVVLLLLVLLLPAACTAGPRATAVPTAVAPSAAPESTTAPAYPTPPPTAIPTTHALVEVSVYFTDVDRYAVGTPPFEEAVARQVPASSNLAEAVLAEFFRGPTEEERADGLEAITSGFTGLASLRIEDGIAHVYLAGECSSGGATYTVAQPIMANLLQFEEIRFVKIYDAEGTTEQPEGETNSIPFCLEP